MRRTHSVGVLVVAVTLGATAVLAASAGGIASAFDHHATTFLVFCGLTIGLQALSLTGFASSISVAGAGMLATGFVLGVGPAVLTGFLAAFVHAAKKRPRPYKAIFNAGAFGLAAAGGTAVFTAVAGHDRSSGTALVGAQLGACVFLLVNVGLLTLAMAVAEQRGVLSVWRERFRWLTPHYLAFGPLAFVMAVGVRATGAAELAAGVLFPLLLAFLVRESLALVRGRRSAVRSA